MIDAIKLRDLRNGEYIQFMKDTCTIVTVNDPATLNVVAQHAGLLAEVSSLEGIFKTATANPITRELLVLDEQRDNAFNGLQFVLKGFEYHFEPEVKNAASLLTTSLKIYGSGVAVQNLQGQTATINSIVGDLQNKPELTAAIASLNLTDWVTHLKSVNDNFAGKYILRTQEYGNANPENLKSRREVVNQSYYELRKFIDAYGVINSGVGAYAKVTNELNALIGQYNKLVTNRQSNSSTPSDPAEPEV